MFRELSITQCLRSHRHRRHLWLILMPHPYNLNAALSQERQSTAPLPERKYGAGGEGEQAWEKSDRVKDTGRLILSYSTVKSADEWRRAANRSPELEREYRGGGCCIPRANHCSANNGVELRARWNNCFFFFLFFFWKVVRTNFPSCPFDWQADFHRGLISFSSSAAWRKPTTLTVNSG